MSESFDALLDRLKSADVEDPQTTWQRIAAVAGSREYSFQQCRQLWEVIFRDWPTDGPPAPIWCPALSDVQQSNIAAFCSQHDLEDFDALHRWSIDRPANFWQATIDQLGICFATRPQQLLDDSEGVESARWLVGAEMNIVDSCLLSTETEDQANEPAIIWSDRSGQIHTWSRADLLARVHQVASAFHKGKLNGNSVAMLTPMTPWSVAIYLGIIHAGGNVVSIADSFSAPEIRRRLDIVNCQIVVTYDWMQRAGRKIELLQRVHQASDLGVPIQAIVLHEADQDQLGSTPTGLRDTDHSLAEMINQTNSEVFPSVVGAVTDTVNILFSSGTTGDPKAIVWDHSTPIKCASDAWFHQDIHARDVVAWPTNLGWMMGPWLIYASLINKAAIALYHDVPTSKGFGKFIQDSRVTMLGLVPSIVKAWRATGDMESFDWSAVRCFSSTGESSNSEDYFYLSSLADFKPIIEYCGGTEIGGGYITSSVTHCNAPATFSTPALGLDVRILDEDGRLADEGELFLVPPSIGLSSRLLNRDHYQTYFADVPQVSGAKLRRHGDHFRALPGGYYEAGGRADDTMNLGGIKVSSIEIEKVINQLPGVLESAAVAVEDKAGGPSQLVLFLVVEDADIDPNDEWLSQCNRILKVQLNPLFRAAETRVLEKLPRTASNKIMRRLLRDSLK